LAVEELLEQSERQPLVYALSLHGFIVGQPFRLRPVRQAIKHCVKHKHKDRVWYTRAATSRSIASRYRKASFRVVEFGNGRTKN
jgi:rRNA processing protein Krr1/Pno1